MQPSSGGDHWPMQQMPSPEVKATMMDINDSHNHRPQIVINTSQLISKPKIQKSAHKLSEPVTTELNKLEAKTFNATKIF